MKYARFYRHAGVPGVGYGVPANSMSGPDEFAAVVDLEALYRVIALAAFDSLCQGRARA